MKKIKYLVLFIFLFLLIPINISADEHLTCSKIIDEHEKYLQYKSEFDDTDCSNIDSEEKSAKCTDLSTKINSKLQYLYNSIDSYPDCELPEIKKTLEDNDTTCKSVYHTDLKKTTNSIMAIFYIIAPFLLILFGSIDLTKIVTANDPEGIKKARSNLIKRFAAFILIFLLPAFINIVLSFISQEYKLDGNYYSCKSEFYYYQRKYVARYKKNGIRSGGSVTLSGDFNGLYTIRDSAPGYGDSYYQGYSNIGQCVWFARSRAKEIVDEISKNGGMTKEKAANLLEILDSNCGNGGEWLEVGREMGFKTSTNVSDVAAPALISWKKKDSYGHVAVIESVTDDKVIMSEGWSTSDDKSSCPNDWDCIGFAINEYNKEDFINGVGASYGTNYYFSGYVFFTELEGE